MGSPGRWQWLQMRARIRTTVPCDAVEARPPGRAGALVKAVFNIYDMFVDSGDIVRQGAFSTWAPARFRGALAGSCRHGGMQTGRPDWSADCRCQANSKVCAQHVLGRGEAHPFANHRQQQREAVHVAAAVCSTQADARTRQHTACGCQQTGFLLYLRSRWRAGRRNAQGCRVAGFDCAQRGWFRLAQSWCMCSTHAAKTISRKIQHDTYSHYIPQDRASRHLGSCPMQTYRQASPTRQQVRTYTC